MSDVVVVGGGLGGLAAALALAREDVEVTVLEAARGPAADHFGYTLWPPGTRVLEWLGVLDQVVDEGCRLDTIRWLDRGGDELFALELPPMGELGRFVGVRPSRVVAALRAAADAAGVRVLDGVRDWTVERARRGWRVRLETQVVDCAVLVGCDGPGSRVRGCMGVPTWRWVPPRQRLVTGVGGPVPWNESRQAVSTGWSGGCVSLGRGGSWLYAIVHEGGRESAPVRRYGEIDADAGAALAELERVIEVRPGSVRVSRWARDGVVLIGDAAHGMPPHLGLGGSQTLEDAPVLAEVITGALRRGDVGARVLDEFQRRRERRVACARRISELWALSTTGALPGVGTVRDVNFRRVARQPHLLETLIRELASARPPRLSSRLRLMLA